ncbi:MAG: aldehyde ferredoxin oxidoreductase family protein [Armatimonadetes bacterium]|nr:aldehyde ferredoxin oxidoreductase family protein [Armatimonadota bacterium]
MALYGWTGRILRVNLTDGTTKAEPLNEQWAREYIGGRGVGARYLYEEVDPRIHPLDSANKIIFATGPLTGTSASCGARYMVITKGLQTNTITTSNSGGHWGPELKFAGYDLVILEGKAPRPVYLWIYNDHVEIRDAAHLWGKTVFETEDRIRTELGQPDAIIASIGPAGENLVKFACIMNDKHRAAGRSGVGAVMGSKNLKAIAVRGTRGVRLANPQKFMEAHWALKKKLKLHPVTGAGLPTYGTDVLMNVINEVGTLPTRNFREAQFEGAYNISGEELREKRLITNKACFACTIACGRVNRLGEGAGRWAVTTHPRNWKIATEGPEYEPAWALGADTGVSDLDAVIKANYVCNELGLDPISMGATLAAAMEMYETGTIGDAQTGMPLRFGSAEALVRMVEATAYREGFGNELAEGAMRMTARFGRPELFMGVKGSEFPAYDPRAVQGMGLTYATSNRGACHLKSYTIAPELLGIPEKLDPHTTENKAFWVKLFQDVTSVFDASGVCIFLTFGIGLEDLWPELAAATGTEYTLDDLLKAGERIWNLERLWNQKAGFTAKDDTLPKRILEEPIPAGPTQGQVNRLHEMLPEYYRLRGWTEDGRPTPEKLAELGIPA